MVRRKRWARKHLQDLADVSLDTSAPHAASQTPTPLPLHGQSPAGTHAPLSRLPPRLAPLAVGVEAPPGPEEGGGVQAPVGAALHGAAAAASAAGPAPASPSLGGGASAPAPPPGPAFRAAAPPRGRPPGGHRGEVSPFPGPVTPTSRPPGPARLCSGCGRTELGRSRWAGAAPARSPRFGRAACKRPLKFQTRPKAEVLEGNVRLQSSAV